MSELFTKLERAAWGGFVSAQGRLFQRIEDDLRRRFQLTHAEFEVLLRLCFAAEGRARIQELAEQSLLSRSGTSRAVERLQRAGHLERTGAEEDGRGAYAVLTAKGRAHFFDAAREHVALVRREFLSRFTEAEQVTLAAFFRRINHPEEATPNSNKNKQRRSRAKRAKHERARTHKQPAQSLGLQR